MTESTYKSSIRLIKVLWLIVAFLMVFAAVAFIVLNLNVQTFC